MRKVSLLAAVLLLSGAAHANLVGDLLGWQYYAYGGAYTSGNASGQFSVTGASTTTVSGAFDDGVTKYFNIVSSPNTILFDYSVTTRSNTWSPSTLSLAPTVHNGIVINLLSGSNFTSVTIDRSTTMAGFGAGNLSFTGKQIQVDWTGLPFDTSTRVALNVNSGQTVFLNFAADSAARYTSDGVLFNTTATYAKPDSGYSSAQINQIVSAVQSEYAGYNVNFTTTRPVAGNYHTVNIGGTGADVTAGNANLKFAASTLGQAQSINLRNSNPNASVVVFSALPYFNGAGGVGAVAQVIDHETGHILGLQHVLPSSELMYPYASAAATSISSGNESIAHINADGKVVSSLFGYTQNSDADLKCAVGPSSGPVSCDGADSYGAFSLFLDSFSTVYNAKLYILRPDGSLVDGDGGLMVQNLGNIASGSRQTYSVPYFGGERVILLGSSQVGGAPDIFFGGANGFAGDPDDPLTFAQALVSDDGQFAWTRATVYRRTAEGFQAMGLASLGAVSSVPEPAMVVLFAAGLAGLLARRRQGVTE